MHNSPPLPEGAHLLVGLVVTCHLLRGGGCVLQNLQLRLGIVLEVLAVAEDLTRLHQRHRLLQAFLLPSLSVLKPGLKHLIHEKVKLMVTTGISHLDSSLELSPELDVLHTLERDDECLKTNLSGVLE